MQCRQDNTNRIRQKAARPQLAGATADLGRMTKAWKRPFLQSVWEEAEQELKKRKAIRLDTTHQSMVFGRRAALVYITKCKCSTTTTPPRPQPPDGRGGRGKTRPLCPRCPSSTLMHWGKTTRESLGFGRLIQLTPSCCCLRARRVCSESLQYTSQHRPHQGRQSLAVVARENSLLCIYVLGFIRAFELLENSRKALTLAQDIFRKLCFPVRKNRG